MTWTNIERDRFLRSVWLQCIRKLNRKERDFFSSFVGIQFIVTNLFNLVCFSSLRL